MNFWDIVGFVLIFAGIYRVLFPDFAKDIRASVLEALGLKSAAEAIRQVDNRFVRIGGLLAIAAGIMILLVSNSR